ncbi:MAG: peptidylprolyl isomerase [Myxococcales bacterium]
MSRCAGPEKAPERVRPDDIAFAAETGRAKGAGARALLAEPDAAARARGALAAGRIGDREAVPALTRLLADDPAVASVAAWALGRIEGGEPALLGCLASSCPAAAAAARALGHASLSAAALDALAQALRGKDPAVAGAAATSLGVLARLGPKGTDEEVASRAGSALAGALASPDARVRYGAAYAFGRIAGTAPPGGLAALLSDPDAEVRAVAARAWGKQGGDPRRLETALRDGDVRVRVEAARALGELGRAATTGHSGLAVRFGAGEARSLLTAAIPPAVADLRGDPTAARFAHGLVAIFEAAAIARVDRTAIPEPASISGPTRASTAAGRCAAALAFDRIEGRISRTPRCGAGLEPEWRSRMRVGILAAELAETDPDVRPAAVAALHDSDSRVRAQTAGAAGPALANELRALLDDRDPFVVADAASALAKEFAVAQASIPAAEKAVQRLLGGKAKGAGDPASDALAALAQLLGATGAKDRAAPLLLSLVPTASPFLHRSIADALRALGAPALAVSAPSPAIPDEAAAGFPGETRRPRMLRLRTTAGDLALELHSRDGEAPLTSAAIGALAARGFYRSLSFHRVVPDFVVQGGDPRGDGDGGPGWAIPDEHTPLPFRRGTAGIATNGPETGGSQLFVCHSAQPHLDGRYTAFAELQEGESTLDSLQVGDEILSASVE